MACGCNNPIMSWYDLENQDPKNPFDLLAYASLGGVVGTFERTTDFLTPGGGFVSTPLALSGTALTTTWASDEQQMIGNADMWNQQHDMVNVGAAIAPPLHKLAFLHGGTSWQNTLELNLAVDVDYLLLSFLNNAGTRGDAQGTIPCIRFAGPHVSGLLQLIVTTKIKGTVTMGIKTVSTAAGDPAMMEMDWVIV